jgi:hypothetical protein
VAGKIEDHPGVRIDGLANPLQPAQYVMPGGVLIGETEYRKAILLENSCNLTGIPGSILQVRPVIIFIYADNQCVRRRVAGLKNCCL